MVTHALASYILRWFLLLLASKGCLLLGWIRFARATHVLRGSLTYGSPLLPVDVRAVGPLSASAPHAPYVMAVHSSVFITGR